MSNRLKQRIKEMAEEKWPYKDRGDDRDAYFIHKECFKAGAEAGFKIALETLRSKDQKLVRDILIIGPIQVAHSLANWLEEQYEQG